MADITKCANQVCKIKEKCYRHTAKSNEFRQSICNFNPDNNNECKFFWENKQ